jgi:hypothetical protein
LEVPSNQLSVSIAAGRIARHTRSGDASISIHLTAAGPERVGDRIGDCRRRADTAGFTLTPSGLDIDGTSW